VVDADHSFIVMELCSGGSLNKYKVKDPSQVDERKLSRVIYQVLSALQHCHRQGIVHRDIKPDNILFGIDGKIKLVDFGLATYFGEEDLRESVGTPSFTAPEVLNNQYSYQCDIWSVGVLLFLLVSGYLPFSGENEGAIFRKIKTGKLTFPEGVHGRISTECIELIILMLKVDVSKRISIDEALKHPWFKKYYRSKAVRSELTSEIVIDQENLNIN
jgi:serine/threonine protein kinase